MLSMGNIASPKVGICKKFRFFANSVVNKTYFPRIAYFFHVFLYKTIKHNLVK